MSSEKKYISFYDDSNKKVLPSLLKEIRTVKFCKKEDIDIAKEELIFEDAGIKFKMSQLLQVLRGPMRINEEIPKKTNIIYKKDNIYVILELIFDYEILGNILYYEIRINDVFDILDNAGVEIKDFVQSEIENYKKLGK